MITLNFRRMVEQVVARMGFPQIIAPNTIGHAGNLTTSGTTELTLITQTLTAPPVAGQLLVTAFDTFVSGSVAGDNFAIKLYVAGAVVAQGIVYVHATGAEFHTVSLMGQAAVTAAAGQIVKLTVTRNGGTGTITAQGAYNGMSWIILPGAGTTA